MTEVPDSTATAASAATARAHVDAQEMSRHLRMMLVTMPVLLLGAIVALAYTGTVQESISAYYGQPIRDVFVGAMVGTAACLIVYRGFRPLEDYAFNVAGFYAIFVAFVPHNFAENLATISEPGRGDALLGLRVSLAAVVVVAAIFVLLEWRWGHWTHIPTLWGRRTTRYALILVNALGAAFLLLAVAQGVFADDFWGVHLSAAVLLFASLALAVATHGWPAQLSDVPDQPRYRWIFWLMVAGVPLALALEYIVKTKYTVLILEIWEIGFFAWFWILETKRTWSEDPVPH